MDGWMGWNYDVLILRFPSRWFLISECITRNGLHGSTRVLTWVGWLGGGSPVEMLSINPMNHISALDHMSITRSLRAGGATIAPVEWEAVYR